MFAKKIKIIKKSFKPGIIRHSFANKFVIILKNVNIRKKDVSIFLFAPKLGGDLNGKCNSSKKGKNISI